MLLPTKLASPRAPGALVDRPRLVARIEANLSRRLTLISAPAGSGKSTLLGQWIAVTRARTAWLSLDGTDDDPRRFGAYLLAALASIVPELSEQADALFSSPGRPDLIGLFTRAVVLPFAKEKQPTALVLDDFHLVQQPAIHEAIAWLIEQLPPNLHLVVATRTTPAFPLARWRVRREVLEIGPAELRFSSGEATAFYNEVMALSLSASEVEAIELRTEGWAAALQLSALSLKGGTETSALVRALAGEHRLIAEYLAEEVLDQQPPDRRRFLLETSILDRLSAELCEAVTKAPGAQEQLRALEAANLFLIPLDESGGWFRYHHLFAELLRKRSAAERLDTASLHRRAAEWFAARDRFQEAVRHAIAAGSDNWAAERMEVWGEALIKTGEIELLREWTASFDPEISARAPSVGVQAAWAAVLSGHPEEVEAKAAAAETAALQVELTPLMRAKIAQNLTGSRAFAAQYLGQTERAVELSEAALAGPLDPEIRAALQLNAGQAARRMGRYARAVELLSAAALGGLATGHVYLAFGALFHRAASLRVLGRLQDALHTTEELQQLVRRSPGDGYLTASGVEVERAYAYWLAGDDERAVEHARRASEGLDLMIEPWDIAYGRWMLVRVLISAGDLDEAAAVLDETRLPLRSRERCMVEYSLQTARAELALAQGDVPRAKLMLIPGQAPDLESAFDRSWAEARVALARGESIEEAAEQALTEASAAGRLMHAAAWAALLAAVRHDAHSIAEAKRLAERTGIERWRSLFASPSASPSRSHSIRARPVPPAIVEPMIESLTQRELEVLGLIAEGLSNQEAAGHLYVSVGTVKTHVHKILAKLAADNRTEAVHKARTLGLIR